MKEDLSNPPLSQHSVTSLFPCAQHKSGMEGVDRNKINEIIAKASYGSAFWANQTRKSTSIQQKAAQLARHSKQFQRLDGIFCHSTRQAQFFLHPKAQKILNSFPPLPLHKLFLHLDLDMFFCAVEQRDNPSLGNKPFAVGSPSMISTANYIARRYGVRAAMPGFIALKLCPTLVIIEPDHQKYARVGQAVRQVLQHYDRSLYGPSCDEISLDLSPYMASKGLDICDRHAVEQTIEQIRHLVTQATRGLTCSGGAAHTRLLAKMCSNVNKPNGQYILLGTQQHTHFLQHLSLEGIPGIGTSKQQLLKQALGITHAHQLLDQAPFIVDAFPEKTARFLLRSCLGLDPPSDQLHHTTRQSISCERTFSATSHRAILSFHLQKLCAVLADSLQHKHFFTRCLSIKIKLEDFTIRQLSRHLDVPLDQVTPLQKVAKSLLHQAFPLLTSSPHLAQSPAPHTPILPRIRLLGLRASQLSLAQPHTQHPLRLFLTKPTPTQKPFSFKKTLRLSRPKKNRNLHPPFSVQSVLHINWASS